MSITKEKSEEFLQKVQQDTILAEKQTAQA
jgi:hypothetical protein